MRSADRSTSLALLSPTSSFATTGLLLLANKNGDLDDMDEADEVAEVSVHVFCCQLFQCQCLNNN